MKTNATVLCSLAERVQITLAPPASRCCSGLLFALLNFPACIAVELIALFDHIV